jgi:hypothetical protein
MNWENIQENREKITLMLPTLRRLYMHFNDTGDMYAAKIIGDTITLLEMVHINLQKVENHTKN